MPRSFGKFPEREPPLRIRIPAGKRTRFDQDAPALSQRRSVRKLRPHPGSPPIRPFRRRPTLGADTWTTTSSGSDASVIPAGNSICAGPYRVAVVEIGNGERQGLGDVVGTTGDSERAGDEVQMAASLHPHRNAIEVHRHLPFRLFFRIHPHEIRVEDAVVEGVELEVVDHHLLGSASPSISNAKMVLTPRGERNDLGDALRRNSEDADTAGAARTPPPGSVRRREGGGSALCRQRCVRLRSTLT